MLRSIPWKFALDFVFATSFCFSSSLFSFAQAAEETTQPAQMKKSQVLAQGTKDKGQKLIEALFALPHSTESFLVILALSGASDDSLKVIYEDVKGNLKKEIQPSATLIDGEIAFDQKKTGVRITSYSPFNVTYKGRTWTPEKNATLDQNYFSLRKFLKPTRNALMDFLVPSSYAAQTPAEADKAEQTYQTETSLSLTTIASSAAAAGLSHAYGIAPAVGAALTPVGATAVAAGIFSALKLYYPQLRFKERADNQESIMWFLKSDIEVKSCAHGLLDINSKDAQSKESLQFNLTKTLKTVYTTAEGEKRKNFDLPPAAARFINALKEAAGPNCDPKAATAKIKEAQTRLMPLLDEARAAGYRSQEKSGSDQKSAK